MKRMMRNSVMLTVSIVIMSCILALPGTVCAGGKPVRLILGLGATEGAQEGVAEMMLLNMYWGALDYRIRTYHVLKGKYDCKFVGGVFKDQDESLAAVASGAGEFTYAWTSTLVQLDPDWEAVNAPGVFDNWDHFKKTMNTPAWKTLHQKMSKEKGVTIIKWAANVGAWYLYTSKGPVKTMQDLEGQKIRYAGGKAFAKSIHNMGATAINVPYTEVVTSLQTNMIDGLVTDWFGAIYYYDLPRYTKYAVNIPWLIMPVCIVANSNWWDSLPAKERTAMKDVFDRIDTSVYFENAAKGLAQVWAADSRTELLELSSAEAERMKEMMRKGSADVLKEVDQQLVKAIESSR